MIETTDSFLLDTEWTAINLDAIKTEIVELHQFFQDWFRADLPNTDSAFARMDTLSEDFKIVIPDGSVLDRKQLLRDLRPSYGMVPEISIWVEDVQLHMAQNGFALATYIKRQVSNEANTKRRSTAFFSVEPSAPNGLSWLHVHETWIT